MIYQDGRSGKWYKRRNRKLLFLAVLLVSITAVVFFLRPERIADLSGGIYKETFKTTYRPLQKELIQLHKDGVFQQPENTRTVPDVFVPWYSAEKTRKILSGEKIFPEQYRTIVSSSLLSALKQKKLVFASPLENPVPGDLFRILVCFFEQDLATGDYSRCAETLDQIFCFSSLLLNSNAADIYFISKTLDCAKLYEKIFSGNRNALALWNRKKTEMTEKYLFAADGLYQIERLRILQEFEMIRIHGIRIFDEKVSGSSQIKEGLGTGSFSGVKSGISTTVTDFFYNVDRDQTMALSILRGLLYNGVTPYMLKMPDRKISIHCYSRIVQEAEVLSSLFDYLEKRAE